MPFRLFRRVKIAPGLHLNISKSGLGFSQKIGPVTLGSKRTTINLPGTGLSYYQNNSTGTNQPSFAETSELASSGDDGMRLFWIILGIMSCCVFGGLFYMFSTPINRSTPTPFSQNNSTPILRKGEIFIPANTYSPSWTPGPSPTRTIRAVRSPVPPPTRRATWTPEPPTNTPLPIPKLKTYGGGGSSGSGGSCSCNKDTYNCSDFPSQNAAQICLYRCWQAGKGDIHKLDRDNDGMACDG